VYSPVIDRGEADFIVSFELLEAARWMEYLKPGGKIVTSTQQIDPMPVITGKAAYPENLTEKMQAAGVAVDALDCLTLAEKAGSPKAVNIVLTEFRSGKLGAVTLDEVPAEEKAEAAEGSEKKLD
jgi:indolepyruvate ferredoxin oxidoreductase beta subunit